MKVRQVVLARSLQMLKSPTGTVGYLPDVVQEIKSKYGFLVAPKDEELLDSSKGAVFRHGKLAVSGITIIIDRFTLFNDGVVADTASSTEDCDRFLTNIIEWAKTAIPKAEARDPRYYLSQLEIHLNVPLEQYAPAFRPIGENITNLLGRYGISAPRYEVSALNLHFDQLGKTNPQPGAFFIDRRLNVPFAENVWFSQAPLKTGDHITLLQGLER
jgi:hypothetical protein